MKILLDARLWGLENAGLGRYVMNLVSSLAKLDKKNEYAILLTKKYTNTTLPSNWKKIPADFRHYSLAEQINLPKIIKEENPDITHFPHFNVPVTFKGKFIVTIHDLLMHKNVGLSATTLPAPLYFIKRAGYKTVFRKAVINSQKIIVPSVAVKKEVTDYYHINPGKISVIYEGVDEKITGGEDARSKYGIKDPFFLYAGNAYPHKNLKRLIEAVILLNKNSDQKIILAIASARNIFTQRLESLVKKLNAGDVVKLLGFVPDADLGSLYQNSLAFVFPSLSEGFGLPGLEAMASGTLVLTSDIPVFKEVYKDNAIYFNPLDFSSIEKTMRKVLSLNPSERKELVDKGKAFAKTYSWDEMAGETLKLYEKLV
ncbi:MAG TPA: glycosyltransferase family 1 protein [Patescibacteria group bacterium]|nr:glycosyltransferase family 1 protein [Patescibacteria group bacterium]